MLVPRILSKPDRLPDGSYIELVMLLIAGRLPIAVMAITVVIVAALAQIEHADIAAIIAAGAVVALLAVRAVLVTRFRRQTRLETPAAETARRWEAGYAAVLIPYATTLGLFNYHLAVTGSEAVHMLVVAETYGFCAGMVARGFVRPRLCAIMVAMGALPTAAGLIVLAWGEAASGSRLAMFVVAALFVFYTLSSLETVVHLYRALLAQLATKRHLAGLARLDPLTGLPNRLAMRELLSAEPQGDEQVPIALHLIDLDGFKAVNDRFGHPAGDRVLQEVARRLTATVRTGDLAVRLGGDEFGVVQAMSGGPGEARVLARRLAQTLGEPYDEGGEPVRIGASVGVAIEEHGASDVDRLIEQADSALYRAKRQGGGAVRVWTSAPVLSAVAA